jgi:hypothetical protein
MMNEESEETIQVKRKDLYKIAKHCEESFHPKVTFCTDLLKMKDEANSVINHNIMQIQGIIMQYIKL